MSLLFSFNKSQCSEIVATSIEKTLWLDLKVILVHAKILCWLFSYWIFIFLFNTIDKSPRDNPQ